ncbi:dihydrodipicolinate synthase family protein [Chloroflexota bacterium]
MSVGQLSTKYDCLYVTVVTPFKENYEVDEAALRRLLQYFMQPKFINAGGGIIINPEAGEVFYLNREEKRRNVQIALEECGGNVPVFAGVADLRTEDAVRVAIDAKVERADGLFLMPPVGMSDITVSWDANKYPEVFIDMAKAEVEAVDLPAIVHPVASSSTTFGKGLPMEPTLQMCNEIPNIVGWKMTYSYQGSIIIAKALRALDRHVALLRSTAMYFHENLATGYFDGTVTGALNYAMEPMIDHITAWKRGDIDEARRIWESGLADLHYYVYSESSRLHVRYKLATWLRGLIPSPFMRPPMPKPRRDEILTLRELLVNSGLSVISEGEVSSKM